MESYSLILIGDEQSPVRRFDIPRRKIRNWAWMAGALAVLCVLATWDYWRLRADNSELASLRIEAAEQRLQIRTFERNLARVQSELERVLEFERKVRIIANLPGAIASGGAEVTDLAPALPLGAEREFLLPPAGVPIDVDLEGARGGDDLDGPLSQGDGVTPDSAGHDLSSGLTTAGARKIVAMGDEAELLKERARFRGVALGEVVSQLKEKGKKLAAMPSIWPARGWLTSRFGPRVSPFTGRRQSHSGVDIAAKAGTPIIAPARARVTFTGGKGALGKTIVLDHGYGVRTVYGHSKEILVKTGDLVQRGQQIALLGSSGRSTGPHLHYVVEVGGKPRNPLNYIFD